MFLSAGHEHSLVMLIAVTVTVRWLQLLWLVTHVLFVDRMKELCGSTRRRRRRASTESTTMEMKCVLFIVPN